MKKIFTLLLVSAATSGYTQTKTITQAIINTKTTIIAPDEEEIGPNAPTGGDGGMMRIMRFGGDGETKTTTWLKNELLKTFSETESSRTTVIRDNEKKLTTTIMEMMGRKMGFYATDEDQVQMRKSMDSMMQQRAPTQSDVEELLSKTEPSTDIVYLDGIKKIAGYECKKAMIIATRSNGKTDTTNVWYVPDLKLKGVSNTGGSLGGFGSMSPQLSADDMINLNGFPMQYERKLNRGRKMIVEVTKLVTDKEVTDKEFNIPKDVEVKPMKEMQNGGGFRMRIGG